MPAADHNSNASRFCFTELNKSACSNIRRDKKKNLLRETSPAVLDQLHGLTNPGFSPRSHHARIPKKGTAHRHLITSPCCGGLLLVKGDIDNKYIRTR